MHQLPQASVQAFFDSATNTVSYIVHDPATKKAVIIDPVLDFTPRNGRIATKSADTLLAAARKGSRSSICSKPMRTPTIFRQHIICAR